MMKQKNQKYNKQTKQEKYNLQSDQRSDHQEKQNPPIFWQDHENPDQKTRNKMRNQKGSIRILLI